MSKRQFLSLLGVWIMIFLFLGFPALWHKILAVATGLIIIIVAYNIVPTPNKEIEEKSQATFTENSQG